MDIKKGQGLYIQILNFADGVACRSPRTFLVIDIDNTSNIIKLLNVSSTKDKETKTLFGSNKSIDEYDPPFNLPSFVKMDVIYEIPYSSIIQKLRYGQPLKTEQFNAIEIALEDFWNGKQKLIHQTTAVPFSKILCKTSSSNKAN